MKPHVHDESESASGGDHLHRWNLTRMARHLRDVHGMTVPMFWDLGRAHQAHLESHQTPTPEEAPVPEPHDHGGSVADWHSNTDRRSVAYHLNEVHGLETDDIDVREIYGQHSALHGPEPKPEPKSEAARHYHQHGMAEMHRQGSEAMRFHLRADHGMARGPANFAEAHEAAHAGHIEQQAIELYVDSADGSQPDWDDLGAEERDRFREIASDKLSPQETAELLGVINKAIHPEPVRQILVDRLICAMAGVDFDRDWAADDGLGQAGRYAMRAPYQAPAERLLAWMERGGAMHIPQVASLDADLSRARQAREESESLVHDLEDINNALRTQLAQREGEVRGLQDTLEDIRIERDQRTRERDEAREARERQVDVITHLENQLGEEMAKREPDVSTAPEDPGVRLYLGEQEITDLRQVTVDVVGRSRAVVEIRRAAKAFREGDILLFTKDAVANMLVNLAEGLEK